jgi:hypothetical protein
MFKAIQTLRTEYALAGKLDTKIHVWPNSPYHFNSTLIALRFNHFAELISTEVLLGVFFLLLLRLLLLLLLLVFVTGISWNSG